VIPDPRPDGTLPPGVHEATWREIVLTFGTTPYRRLLLGGLARALQALRAAGCQRAYVDGSFVTAKSVPADYDGCYDLVGVDPERLHPALRDFSEQRAAQKTEFLGEMFPASWVADWRGQPYLEFFQQDRNGNRKEIIAIGLTHGGLP
jgi:hypothetical protein